MTSPETTEWVRDLIAGHISADGPGIAVGITRGDETLCSAAYGLAHIELPLPLTSKTLLPLASITKHMTALCALVLEREGRIKLDASIGAYLPQLPAAATKPTLRQLLSHSSGLRCHLDVELFSGFTAPRPDGFGMETLRRLTSVNAPPGAWQVYGNAGFHLVSRAIETVVGSPFSEVMRDRIFAPLGLQNTQVARSAPLVTPGLASLYSRDESGAWRNQSHLRVESLGEGGVCSSLEDMLLWARSLRAEDARIDKALWKALRTPAQLADGALSEYGLGLVVQKWRGVDIVGHSGLIIGQSSTLLSAPGFGLDIVILANTTLPTDAIARQILERLIGPDVLAPSPAFAQAEDYGDLIGRTFEAPDLWVGFGAHEGRLTLSLQGVEGAPLSCISADRLAVATNLGPLQIFLPEGPRGQSVEVTFGGERHRAEAQGSLSEETTARIMSAAAGTYSCQELPCTITIAQGEEGVSQVTTRGPYGAYVGEAFPLTQRALRVKTPHLSYLLRLEWDGASITSVGYDTLRTRNLPFRRTI